MTIWLLIKSAPVTALVEHAQSVASRVDDWRRRRAADRVWTEHHLSALGADLAELRRRHELRRERNRRRLGFDSADGWLT